MNFWQVLHPGGLNIDIEQTTGCCMPSKQVVLWTLNLQFQFSSNTDTDVSGSALISVEMLFSVSCWIVLTGYAPKDNIPTAGCMMNAVSNWSL